jgi:SPP1 gp7 family putative phage head morphogenesis protein
MPRNDAASQNVTDLRRARQRSRAVIRDIQDVIEDFLQGEGIQILQQETATPRDRAIRLNQEITRLATQEIRTNLIPWLEERHLVTMARAARASMNRMQQVLPGQVDETDLLGSANIEAKDRALNAELKNLDAALLYEDSDSLAEEIGDRTTRQLRIGFAKDEPVVATRDDQMDLATRVEQVLLDGDADTRQENGITGQTAQSKAELISHDSVQDAYVTATHRRYLNNGFRWATYDAVIDRKTSTVCRRLNEVTVDLKEQPWLLPPNHPWCRSDIRPLLQLPEGEEPITEEEIGDDHLNRIWGTNGFRPKVIDTEAEFNPTVLNERLERTGVA